MTNTSELMREVEVVFGDVDAETTGHFRLLVAAAQLDPRSDFRYADLSDMSLVDADIRGFDFTGSDLRGCGLQHCLNSEGVIISDTTRLDDEDRSWWREQSRRAAQGSLSAQPQALRRAFHLILRDVYYAEKQSVRSLTRSAKIANVAELKKAFEDHRDESAGQVERLEQVFELLGEPARARTSEAMQGIISEMQEDLEEFGGSPAADAVLIGCAQAVEHYEIARYGTLKSWAGQLGFDEVERLLDQTLQEEKAADQKLSQVAEAIAIGHVVQGEIEEDGEEKHEASAKLA